MKNEDKLHYRSRSYHISKYFLTPYIVIKAYPLPLGIGFDRVSEFNITYFRFGDDTNNRRYLVISKGVLNCDSNPLIRINSACPWGILGSVQCDCSWQFEESKRILDKDGSGAIIYAFDHLGKGVGLENHSIINAEEHLKNPNKPLYEKDIWADPFIRFGGKLDYRVFDDVIDIIGHFNIKNMRLLTNNPLKLNLFEKYGITIKRVPLEMPLIMFNKKEYVLKKEIGKHMLILFS